MKNKILPLILISFGMASCSGSMNNENISLKEEAQGYSYVEYLLCDYGPDASKESIGNMVSEWNGVIDSLETTVSNSVGLFPREERDFFDMIWVLIWDSKEKKERGWKEWIEGPAEEWAKKTNSILSCGAATNGTVRNYAFDVSSYRTASQDPEPGGVTGFTYCSYTEDYGKAELLTSLNEFNGWLDALGTPEDGSTYFYTIQEPLFERPIEGSDLIYDYAFHHFWDSEESRNIGSNLFAQTVPVDPDIVTPDCSEMFLYDSYPFRY